MTRRLTVFSAYGRGLRSPELRSIVGHATDVNGAYRGGPPRITAADSVEAGLSLDLGPAFAATLCGFATFVSNETVFDHVSGTVLTVNATRRLGGELLLRSRPLPWLDLHAEAAGVDARFVASGAPVPAAPRLLVTFGAAAVHPAGWRAGLNGFFLAPRPLAHGATGTAQTVLDLMAAYRWRTVEVRLDIENLLDSRWREGEYHFASWFDRTVPRDLLPVTHVAAGPPLTARLSLTLWR